MDRANMIDVARQTANAMLPDPSVIEAHEDPTEAARELVAHWEREGGEFETSRGERIEISPEQRPEWIGLLVREIVALIEWARARTARLAADA